MGFEPTRAEHNGLAVHRLKHSALSLTVASNVCLLAITISKQMGLLGFSNTYYMETDHRVAVLKH